VIQQAGGIVIRTGRGRPRVLLVQARENPSQWIFPKGHVEPNESPPDAARREVLEEAGILGEVGEAVGSLKFAVRDGPAHITYFLVRFLEEVGSGERRKRRWCTLEEASRLLSFEDARRLLERARPAIEALVRPSGR
jgi:8-oxo-dGTP pyrophosphatase MutT (NUDIX family)